MLELIVQSPQVTIKSMVEQLGLSTTTIEKNLKALRERGVISRVGGRKEGYWHYHNDE